MEGNINNHFRYVEPQDMSLNPKYHCVFCQNKKHSSHLCKKFKRNEEFYDVVVKQKRCKNCLKQFHRSEQCFDDNYCVIKNCSRTDKHSPCVCRHRFPQDKKNKNATRSIWSELYQQNISRYKKNNVERNPTPSNVSKSLSDILNQNEDSVNSSCMTVTASQSERKFASVGTQTADELCSPLPPKRILHLEESQRISSSVNVPDHKRFHSTWFNYLEILCSIYHYWRVKNSFYIKQQMYYPKFSSAKDNFLDILT